MKPDDKKENPKLQQLLSEDDIFKSDPILEIILRRSDGTRKGTFIFLVVLPVVLFLYFMFVTLGEKRFWLQSLTSEDGYLGMSFLGDSMVWPYFFFIPFLFYLLRKAICETANLLTDNSNIIDDGPESQEKYLIVFDEAKNRLLYTGNWRRLYRIAIAAGLIFWLFNTLTCNDPEIFSPRYEAYTTDTPIVIPDEVTIDIEEFPGRDQVFTSLTTHNGSKKKIAKHLTVDTEEHKLTWCGAMQWQDYQVLMSFSREPQWLNGLKRLYQQKRGHKVWLDDPVTIRKWDTELDKAPVSWISARLWVLLLGYSLLPLIFLRVWNLLYVIRSFYKQLSHEKLLKVELLMVDERRNFHAVSTVVLKISYTLAVLLVLLLLSFMKEGVEAEWHNYLLLIPLIPLLLTLFLWPLIAIRDVVQEEKDVEVKRHAGILDDIYKEVDAIVGKTQASSEENQRLAVLKERMALQEKRFEKVSNLAVWPIPKSTVMKFSASIFLPMLFAILDKLLAGLLGFVFV